MDKKEEGSGEEVDRVGKVLEIEETTMRGTSNRPGLRALAVALTALLTASVFNGFSPQAAYAMTGDVLREFVPTGPTGNGRGMAFNGSSSLYYTIVGDSNIYKTDMFGTLVATIPTQNGVGQGGPLAWDGSALWTMPYQSGSFTLYRIRESDGVILSSCNIATQNPTHPAVVSQPNNIGFFPDGLDWTGNTLWVSSEVTPYPSWVVEVTPSCRILRAFNPPNKGGFGASGIAFDGTNLWHSNAHLQQYQTDVNGAETGLSFTNNRQLEDLAYDKVTFAPKCALWSNEATVIENHITAYEVPCAVPRADKLVTDVILGGGPTFVSRDNASRTTTYKMTVELLTNPIINVFSRERNLGPEETDSEITFLASLDDGHVPGHVGGAYIPDSGGPPGDRPDTLTCHSRFDPENPLDQTLVLCPHKEKVPSDGIAETAESDLHFPMHQRVGQSLLIWRDFKLHCLVVGQHTMTFYNKVEVIAPTEDPNPGNNWWRAILQIDCVIRNTPGKVTGGGYINPLTGEMVGEATLNIVDGVMAGVGDKANFGFVIKLDADQMVPTGNLTYYDHAADVRIKSISYDRLAIACPHATFTGTAEVNGVDKKYQVDVDDMDEPGSSPGMGPDTFTIRVLDNSYMATGPLVGGNIQVHKPPECG